MQTVLRSEKDKQINEICIDLSKQFTLTTCKSL